MILLIQETKCSSKTLHPLMEKIWKGCQTIAIDANGTAGGISIAWNLIDIGLKDSSSCAHVISACFHILGSNIHGHLLNFYNSQPPDLKLQLLQFMNCFSQLHQESQLIIGGDFNMITSLEEKNEDYKLFRLKTASSRLPSTTAN